MISDQDLARLALSLEGAQLVRDILDDKDGQLTDGFDFDLLSSLLSAEPPEKALLTLACSAHILIRHTDIEPCFSLSLTMLANDVLDDYGPSYLAKLKSKTVGNYESQALYMQEDLEGFAELFALANDIATNGSCEQQLFSILSDQSAAHAEFLDNQEDDIDSDAPDFLLRATDQVTENSKGQTNSSLILLTDNVIPFPGLFRKF
jgi:hypothetical protein